MERMSFNEEIKEKIYSLSLENIESFLLNTGWKLDYFIDNRVKVFHRKEPEFCEYEILLPASKNLKDYRERIEEVIITLSEFHKKDYIEIISILENKK